MIKDMKLRIKGNTIRIRLSEPEVSRLATGEQVVEQTQFPGATLLYKVHVAGSMRADFVDGAITVQLAKEEVDQWANTDQVSISQEIALQNANKLSILVEKDFKCLTRRPEDEADLFPNPNKHHC